MNRFFTFFLVSFLLHIVVGAVLLSRTGLLGSGGVDQVEINDLQEIPEESGERQTPQSVEKKSSEKTDLLKTDIRQKEVKPRLKPRKKVQRKKKPVEPKLVKLPPPVNKPVSVEKPEPSIMKPVPTKAGEEGEKTAVETTETKEAKEPQTEEWVDEEEMVEEKEKLVTEKPNEEKEVKTLLPAPVKKDSSDQKELNEEKQAPPQNEQIPSSTKSSGSDNRDVPSLNEKAARVHTQLRQIEGNPIPVYPKVALKKKWEGRVEVFYYVNPSGFVEKIQLKSSSGHSVLDNSALRALARYRYYPGQEGWVRHPVEFFLEMEKEVKETVPLGVRKSASQK